MMPQNLVVNYQCVRAILFYPADWNNRFLWYIM